MSPSLTSSSTFSAGNTSERLLLSPTRPQASASEKPAPADGVTEVAPEFRVEVERFADVTRCRRVGRWRMLVVERHIAASIDRVADLGEQIDQPRDHLCTGGRARAASSARA